MSSFNKIVNYNNSGLTSYEISTECVKLSTVTYDELEMTIAKEHQTTKANYDDIEYPEKEDCKDCISRHDCKHKLTFQFNEKCELKQPVELYVDTELLNLSDVRSTLETLFERLDTFKASYRWKLNIDSYEERELKSKEYTIPEQEFSAFGDRYTIEFKVDYRRSSVHKYQYYTQNGKRVTLATITALYKRICKRISEISDAE